MDKELIQAWPVHLQTLWIQSISDFVNSIKKLNKDIVITWGFMPGYDDQSIRNLVSTGFRHIWLDGNREAARRAFISRGTISEELLDIQMKRIESMDISSFNPIIINPFDNEGVFLDVREIVQKILDTETKEQSS